MMLDEAIEHAKEVARTCNDSQCAAEHMQLAEWLRQARGADKASRWYMSKIHELEAENARLREIVEDWYPHMLKRVGPTALFQWGYIKTMVELGMDIYPLNKPELRESEG